MEAGVTSKVRKIFNRKAIKRCIFGLVVLLILGASYYVYVTKIAASSSSAVTQRTAKVIKGDLSATVTGSSSIVSSNRVEVKPSVDGTITKVNFKVGDKVKTGDVLFELESSDAAFTVEKAQNTLAQAIVTQNTTIDSINKLKLKAPFSGLVTGIQNKVGDTITKSTTILTITDQSKLKLIVPFNSSIIGVVNPGQTAYVHLQGLMESVQGTVTYITNKAYAAGSGGEICNVEIEITNPGSLKEGLSASAEIDNGKNIYYSTANSTLAYIQSTTVKSDSGGTLKSLNVKENQYIKSGDVLMELENSDLVLSKDSYDIKLKEYQSALDTAKTQLSYFKIYAKSDGTIVKQTVKVGDSIETSTVVSTISDSEHLEFSIAVDELDVVNLKVGQKASITLDALTATTTTSLSGVVTSIGLEGTASSGVTTYPVTVEVTDPKDIKIGMSVNATIYVAQKTGTLYVPINAVTQVGTVSYVRVKSTENTTTETATATANQSSQGAPGQRAPGQGTPPSQGSGQKANQGANSSRQNASASKSTTQNASASKSTTTTTGYYANTVQKVVEIGINNDTYIEILSGLSEGDEVILPALSTAASTTKTTTTTTTGGGGGDMGGPPMGGF